MPLWQLGTALSHLTFALTWNPDPGTRQVIAISFDWGGNVSSSVGGFGPDAGVQVTERTGEGRGTMAVASPMAAI